MEKAALIVAGSRAVCQSDCSGVGYPKVRNVININADLAEATHYNRTTVLVGDLDAIIDLLLEALGNVQRVELVAFASSAWRSACAEKKAEWTTLREARTHAAPMLDPAWGREVMTQPSALAIVQDFAYRAKALKVFDAGDVQANGFQINADATPCETVDRIRRFLHGLRREFATGGRGSRRAALHDRVLRRRLVHDEPADLD